MGVLLILLQITRPSRQASPSRGVQASQACGFRHMSPQMRFHSETVIILVKLPDQQQALGWMVHPGPWEAGSSERGLNTPYVLLRDTPKNHQDPVL